MKITSSASSFAVLSGLFAASSSICGKLSGADYFESVIIRITFFALMVLCNACVWTLFVKAMHFSGSSLSATVTSAASNYLCSAFAGVFLFGETISVFWWLGVFFVLFGLFLIVDSQEEGAKVKSY